VPGWTASPARARLPCRATSLRPSAANRQSPDQGQRTDHPSCPVATDGFTHVLVSPRDVAFNFDLRTLFASTIIHTIISLGGIEPMGSYTRRIVILAISGLGFGCSSMTAELVSMRSEETNVRDYSHYNPASISYFLPMSIVSITVRRDSAGVHFIDDPMLRKVPDGRFLYRTNLHLSAFSSDDIAITTSASGFLATVTTTLDDKTGDVVKYIASSIITLLTGVPGDKVALVGTRGHLEKPLADEGWT
jgi:hypothetical protein